MQKSYILGIVERCTLEKNKMVEEAKITKEETGETLEEKVPKTALEELKTVTCPYCLAEQEVPKSATETKCKICGRSFRFE